MTYLFILMTLPVIDIIMLEEEMIVETIVANLAILAVFFVIEKTMGLRYEVRKSITYEKIELIKPEHYDSLLADLRERTGCPSNGPKSGRLISYMMSQTSRSTISPKAQNQSSHHGRNNVMLRKMVYLFVIFTTLFALSGCGTVTNSDDQANNVLSNESSMSTANIDEESDNSASMTDASHSNDADPDYDTVFPRTKSTELTSPFQRRTGSYAGGYDRTLW